MADQSANDFAQAMGISLPKAVALMAAMKSIFVEAFEQYRAQDGQSIKQMLTTQSAIHIGQMEALLLEVRQIAENGGTTASVRKAPSGTTAKPRINTWFISRFGDPEFRQLFVEELKEERFANPTQSAQLWRQHAKVIWGEISKSADPVKKELCAHVRKMLDDEYDSNRDGQLDVPDDAASVASEPAEDPAPAPSKSVTKKIPAAESAPETKTAKKPAKKAAKAAADEMGSDVDEPDPPAKKAAAKKPAAKKTVKKPAEDDDDD